MWKVVPIFLSINLTSKVFNLNVVILSWVLISFNFRFLFDLLTIPNFEARIMSLTFQCNYFEALSSIEIKLSNLALVSEQLTGSKELQKVLALILTYGNYMNGENMMRGQADGFSLDILPGLKDVKSNDNNYTFLHFIVKKYIEVFSIHF